MLEKSVRYNCVFSMRIYSILICKIYFNWQGVTKRQQNKIREDFMEMKNIRTKCKTVMKENN